MDRNARAKNKQPDMVLGTFFGELQRIVKIDVPAAPRLNLNQPQTLFFAILKQCNTAQNKDGFWEYVKLGGLEAVDIGLVQCVVGWIFNRGKCLCQADVTLSSDNLSHREQTEPMPQQYSDL